MTLLGIDLGPHWAAIVGSYGVCALVVAGLVIWVVADRRRLTRALAELESRGVRRRSARGGGAA